MVSNFFHKPSSKYGEHWEIKEGSIYPTDLIKELSEFRVHPGEITAAHILPFVPDAAKIDQKKDLHLPALAKIIAEAASIQAISTHLIENTEWDFTAVYFDTIDHFCHAFMKYAPPKMDGITDELFNLFNNVVNSAYKFHDMMLERLISIAGEDTTIILISDHGFHNGKLRPKTLPDIPSSPILEHNPYGIFCISGNNIKKDERIYGASLLDITPTILHLFGLPVGKDMDGKVLLSIFDNKSSCDYIDSWENQKEDFGTHMQNNLQLNTYDYAAEEIKQLVELGYIEEPGENKKVAYEKAYCEGQYNLSRVFLSSKKFKKAIEILKILYQKNNKDIRYNLDLVNCYLNLNKLPEAAEIIKNLRQIENRALPNIDLLEGMLLIKKKEYKKGIQFLKLAEKSNPSLSNIHLEIGKAYLEITKYNDAKRAFTKALNIDDAEAGAYHGLAVCFLRQKDYENAIENALTAIGLLYHFPVAHYHLGEALFMSGRQKEAAEAFEVCLKMSPDFTKAQQWLEKIEVRSQKSEVRNINSYHILHTSDPIPHTSEIIIVSGIPRSGTSMMMKMLQAGGIELLTDNERKCDTNNPLGYFEYTAVKSLAKDNSWLYKAKNKALKVIAHQLYYLPSEYNYKVVFMLRDMNEILRSQQIMLGKNPEVFPVSLANAFKKELEHIDIWVNKEPNVEFLYINYNEVINDSLVQAKKN